MVITFDGLYGKRNMMRINKNLVKLKSMIGPDNPPSSKVYN